MYKSDIIYSSTNGSTFIKIYDNQVKKFSTKNNFNSYLGRSSLLVGAIQYKNQLSKIALFLQEGTQMTL